MRYYIGLDYGGTTTKAAIFDSRGKQLGSCSMETAMLTPKPEFIERDMEEMWDANCSVVKGVLEKTGISPVSGLPLFLSGHQAHDHFRRQLKDIVPFRNPVRDSVRRLAYKLHAELFLTVRVRN